LSNFLKEGEKNFLLHTVVLWLGRLTLKGCPDGEEKVWSRRRERLEKSLIISKQECAQWKERAIQLEKVNQALKEKLGTNSRNSSKPPSQDPFCRSRSF